MTTPAGGAVFGDIDIDGDSAQNAVGNLVHGDVIQTMNRFVRGIPSMYLGSEEVADRVRCYVPVRNHDIIEKALNADYAIVLTGPRGCGRETTAIAAMRHLHPGIPIRRFSLEDEDAEEIYAKGRCGYLIRADDGRLDRLGRCVDAVRASGGFLAVIAGSEIEQQPSAVHLPLMTVDPPDPIQVYQRRVTLRGFAGWSHWDEAPTLLDGASPADARRLADLVEGVQIAGRADPASMQTEVAHAYHGWKEELRGWFTAHQEPHERALLLAAAALSPAAEEAHVYSVASSLAQRLNISMNGGGLAWCPVTQVRDLLEAEEESDRIVFRRHGFAPSALRHALADYPLAQSELFVWLAALPTDDAVPAERRMDLAETFADLAAEHGTAGRLIETASQWGSDGLADLAFIALSRTCLHPRVGGRVRGALYEWSRTARTPQTLKLTIARVCEALGQTYPSIALTRLKHLATHGNRQVHGQVLLATRALVALGNRREVLTAALAWCAEANQETLTLTARRRRRSAGAMLFLELAGLTTDEGLPLILVEDRAVDPLPGWRATLDLHAELPTAKGQAFEDVTRQWLDAALHHSAIRERIPSLLIEAARSSKATQSLTRSTASRVPDRVKAEVVTDLVRRWAAEDRTDRVRREIKEAIVIPLTHPSWLRLLKIIYVHTRRSITTSCARSWR